MKVDIIKTIDKKNYPEEYQELIDKLSAVLNNNFINISNAFNNNLTFKDNTRGDLKDIQLKIDAQGFPTTGNQFQIKPNLQISGMKVIRALCLDNMNVYPLGHPFISYSQNNNLVTINNVTGLQPNTLYELRIEIIG